MEFFEMRRKA